MPVRKGGPSILAGETTASQPTLCPIGIMFHSAILEAFAPVADPTTFPVVSLQCRHESRLRVQFTHSFVSITNTRPMACERLPAVPPMIVCVDVHADCGIYLSFDRTTPHALAAFACHYLRELYPAQVSVADWERTVYSADTCG